METTTTDAQLQIIAPLDIEPYKPKNRGVTVPCKASKESFGSRSRVQSRISFPHYTQSIYSELNRAQSLADEGNSDNNLIIPILDTIEEIHIFREIKRPTKTEIHMLFDLKSSGNSKEPFEALNWKMDLHNSFYFSGGDLMERRSIQNEGSNFLYVINENTQDFLSTAVHYEGKDGSEKLGNVSKYTEEDAEDIIVSDNSGSVLYKMTDDLKLGSDNISCIILDLQGNKVSKAEIDFLENEVIQCKVGFLPGTNSKHKVLILTALVFKLMQIAIAEDWKPLEGPTRKEGKLSFASCFFCFLGK